ncbi:MAG: nucleotidyltransferase domain-containing protein [Candidatus Bathyarchaeota archaeon]|nr:MAG: nucleotidyltransferase domain-containing protein [Candidatus Bathyarchaeota archaeon]
MTKKPAKRAERLVINYNRQRWRKLKTLRSIAFKMMMILEKSNISAITHGSIARGDVTEKSDVDIFIPSPPSSFMIEMTLERAGTPVSRRVIIQATPYYTVKGYIEIDKRQTVSFPLIKMRRVERDFFQFSGEITLAMIEDNIRIAGVDKRLMLIEPIENGHIESSIISREEDTARLLGISIETVLDRTHALFRRDKIGRTGVFIKEELAPNETFEMALKRLA